jgi:hypothetical protein
MAGLSSTKMETVVLMPKKTGFWRIVKAHGKNGLPPNSLDFTDNW